MKLLNCLVFLVFATATFGQSNGIQLYGNFPYLNAVPAPQKIDFEASLLSFGGISAAYHRRNAKNLFIRVQGSYYRNSRDDSQFVYTRDGFFAQLELGLYLLQSKNEKYRWYVSAVGRAFGQWEDAELSNFSSSFTTSELGVGATLLTGMEIDFTDKFYLDCGINLLGFSISNDVMTFDAAGGFGESSSLNFSALRNENLRIGLGYLF